MFIVLLEILLSMCMGLMSDVLSLCGKQLSQMYTISMISQSGYSSNGSVLIVAGNNTLTALMKLSISGTCSLHLWHLVDCLPSSVAFINNQTVNLLIHVISWSHFLGMHLFLFRDVIMVTAFLFLIISAVPKCIVNDIIIINAILLIYILSPASVTLPCHASHLYSSSPCHSKSPLGSSSSVE